MFDKVYLDIYDCWIRRYVSSGTGQPLTITCLDRETCDHIEEWRTANAPALQERGLTISSSGLEDPEPEDLDLAQTGKHRRARTHVPETTSAYESRFFHEILGIMARTNGDVLHTDVDAMWIRSPDALLQGILAKYGDVDIVSSRNHENMPTDVNRLWGFVMNTGFTLFRHTPKTMAFIEALLTGPPEWGKWDQERVNELLLQKGCKWEFESGDPDEEPDEDSVAHARCGDLKVVLLPQSATSRVRQPLQIHGDSRFIAHPDFPFKNASQRLKMFQKYGLCW